VLSHRANVPDTRSLLTDTPANTAMLLSQRSVMYVAARYGGGVLVNAANVFVLTWWIGPRAYGVFVTAVGITTVLASMARAGLDTHLVRLEQDPEREDYDTAFTLILAFSIALICLGVLALPLLNRWLHGSNFALPYLTLLVTVPLVGLAGPPMARLERALRFEEVAKIELGGQVVASAVGATLAWRGLGVWAPVTGHLIWQLFVLVAVRRVSGFSPRVFLNRDRARKMLAFGLGYSASLRVWQIRKLVNPLIVGRILGPEAVAYVGLAARAIEALGVVRAALERVGTAALSRLRDNTEHCQGIMQKGALLDVLVLGPLVLIVTALGPTLLPRLFGARWTGALLVLPFVTTGALINSVFALEASALFVEGRQWVVTRSYFWHVVILGIGTMALTPVVGLVGYGWAELAACIPYAILHRGLPLSLRISLTPILPWLAAFSFALLSSLLASPARWIAWLPLMFLVGLEVRRSLALSSLVQQTQSGPFLAAWLSAALRRSGD